MTLDPDKDSHSLEVKNDPKPYRGANLGKLPHVEPRIGFRRRAPGLQAQGGGSIGRHRSVPSARANESSEENKSEQVNVNSSTSTETEKYWLTPKLAKVSVGIPASYYEKVWQERNPAKEGEEAEEARPGRRSRRFARKSRKDVRKRTSPRCCRHRPKSRTRRRWSRSRPSRTSRPAEIPGPAVTQRAMTWLGQNWPMAAMVGLVLFSSEHVALECSAVVPGPAAPNRPRSRPGSRPPTTRPKSPKSRSKRPLRAASAA